MRLTRLDIRDVRCLREMRWAPAPGLNLLLGANGAGKTSVLEAVHVLGYARSFRGRIGDGLIRSGAAALELYAEWEDSKGSPPRRAGLRHGGQAWQGKLDGENVALLGDLCAALAVIAFEPGSHALMQGPADGRRRYLDWGLFHVEQDFLAIWRAYSRALKQRNRLLKLQGAASELDAWEQELAQTGEALNRRRAAYLQRLQPFVSEVAQELTPELGHAELVFSPGWKQADYPLRDGLLLARERDLAAGFTSVGPHRADWRMRHAQRPADEALSRGQAKLSALACLLGQARDFAAQRGHWPLLMLDDLPSELDPEHQQRLLQWLRQSGAQVILTGTQLPAGASASDFALFHVEQGQLRPARAAEML